MSMFRSFLTGCLVLAVSTAPSRAQSPESDFGRAYYLEAEEKDVAAAAEIYEQVIGSETAPADLKEKARRRLAVCREDLRSRDLARLMPPDALAYLEIRSPGRHLARLLRMAGLTGAEGDEGGTGRPPLPVVVSPKLLRALDEAEGAAVCVQTVNSIGIPSGVVVIKPGNSDLVGGLIETALSSAVASKLVMRSEPVHGHPAYLAPFASIVVTERLVIAGTSPRLVADAVGRLHDDGAASLARSEVFAELEDRRKNALLFSFVNAPPLVAMVKAQMSRRRRGPPEEYRIAQALMDVESLRWAALALGTHGDGVAGDLWVRMDDDNHAIAYHLVRTSRVGREALGAIPAGVAGFLAFGLSGAEGDPLPETRSRAARYVTGLDIGREIFANIRSVLAFVTPPVVPEREGRDAVLPGVGVVLTVRDATRSRALWTELLRIPATALQATPEPARSERIGGREVQVYTFPEGVQIYFAALDDRVILASDRSVVAQAFEAAAGQRSVLQDEGFGKATAEVPENVTKILVVHAGRAFRTAQPFARIPRSEARQIARLLENQTVSILSEETESGVNIRVEASLPDLSPILRQIMAGSGPFAGGIFRAPRDARARPSISRARVAGRDGPGEFATARSVAVVPPPQIPAAFRDRSQVETIVPAGSEWKYSDTGANLGTYWRERQHDDSGWKRGKTPLGYGDEGLATEIGFGDDPENKHITAYFRRSFTVDRPERFGALLIRLRRDDGAAVFINGVEVARDNLPEKAKHDTPSASTTGGPVESYLFPYVVRPGVLRAGENTIAVEVHQANGSSSDLVFELSLEGRLAGPKKSL
ncbi:MAG: hypothetical protein O7J95_04910 [Planctomycetota bacterium]|nr:hypothetical protein [Planctomycetota bacterium]